MKIRTDFVTNSSSSSFIIRRSELTDEQIKQIFSHIAITKKWDECVQENHRLYLAMGLDCPCEKHWYADPCDEWSVKDDGCVISGNTMMDNFDMRAFLTEIGVPKTVVEWGDGYHDSELDEEWDL